MAFRREVDDRVDIVFLENRFDSRAIRDVRVLEKVTRASELGVDVRKACGVSRVRERVKVDDASGETRRLLQEHVNEIAADEPGAAGNQNGGKFSHNDPS